MRRFRDTFITVVLLAALSAALLPLHAFTAAADEEMTSYEPETNDLPGWPDKYPIYGQSCVLMDRDTGAILCSLERNTRRYPASTTKVMTCLLALENLNLDDTVSMTAEGCAAATGDSSNAGTVVGEEFTVEQCLYMLMLKSANDIANQLAIEMAGSLEAFADMMNERAEEIGCTGTHFHNPSGLPDEEHYTTAEDLALIFREAYRNETFRRLISTLNYTVPPTNKCDTERKYQNHNQMINPDGEYYCEYCTGGKTGFTNAAQRTLVTAAEKDGHTLIAVTMRTPDKTDYIDQSNLYTYGFNYFTWTEIPGGMIVMPTDLDVSGFGVTAGGSGGASSAAADESSAAENAASGTGDSSGTSASLYQTLSEEQDGMLRTTYYYSGLPVGYSLTDMPEPESFAEFVENPEEAGAGSLTASGSGTVSRKGKPFIVLLIVILALAAAAGLAAAGFYYKKRLDREREKLRRKRNERRADDGTSE